MTQTTTIDRLRPGHEYPGANLNARTTGRDQDIDNLAASIKSEGILQSLLVCPDPKNDDKLYVIAGNRRLAALRKLKWTDEIPVIVRADATPGSALAMSLAENVTQCPLHPIDRFEAFAALIDGGKTEADIAASYAIGERIVKQSLALGRLSPKIRAAWRKGDLEARAAQAFTLAKDHKAQDAAYDRLKKGGRLWENSIRDALVGSQQDTKKFLTFVGREAYEAAGGKLQTDLFARRAGDTEDDDEEDDGELLVSDTALLIRVAGEKIEEVCKKLVADGWSWAMDEDDAPNNHHSWRRIDTPTKGAPTLQKAKAGCIVSVNYKGALDIEYGYLKPGTTVASPKASGGQQKPKAATALSNSLKQDLDAMAARATQDTLVECGKQEGLSGLLAKIVAAQIHPQRLNHTAEPVRKQLGQLAELAPPKALGEALVRRFDRQRYFTSAPKNHVLRAITETLGGEHAKKLSAGTKAAAWKFALANVPKTWLPPELRTSHYDGPSAKSAKVVKLPAKAKKAASPAKRKKAA